MRSEASKERNRIYAKNRYKENYALNSDKIKAQVKAWRDANKEKIRAIRKLVYQKNKEARKAAARKFYVENSETYKANARRWYAENKDAAYAIRRNRKARVRNAEGSHTAADTARIFKAQNGRCAYCRKCLLDGYHVDHIIPIIKGGSNWPRNLQLTCDKCNMHKHASDPIDFAQRLGLLL